MEHTDIKPQDSIKVTPVLQLRTVVLYLKRGKRRVSPASELSGHSCFVWREERELSEGDGAVSCDVLLKVFRIFCWLFAPSASRFLSSLSEFVLTFLISTTSSSVIYEITLI